ncbi:MAG: hypothetical protein IKS56_06590 [Lachnospiraceae bacterium]|nr:hypothetical protein [Lachnospiraceae bacterium]
MFSKKKSKELPIRTINVWNKNDFLMSGFGKKFKLFAIIKHFIRCIKWSAQRITRGYSDPDVWEFNSYLQHLIPDMLQHLKDNRMGSPGFLGENYINEEGILVNDTCHSEWDKILDKMIFLWRESEESTCSKKNPFEEEFMKAFKEFEERFGFFGEGLLTPEEKEEAKKSNYTKVHFMEELPEYKELYEKHREEDKKIEKYQNDCKDEALDMLKEYFYSLWD